MSGTAVIGALLTGYAPLVGRVPAARIKAAALAEGIVLPAIVLTIVSGVDRRSLQVAASRRRTHRVQVDVMAASYRDLTEIVPLVRFACAGRIGDFAGVTEVDVQADVEGPDMITDGIFSRSHDFRVSFNTSA